jgi:hypothetical protein
MNKYSKILREAAEAPPSPYLCHVVANVIDGTWGLLMLDQFSKQNKTFNTIEKEIILAVRESWGTNGCVRFNMNKFDLRDSIDGTLEAEWEVRSYFALFLAEWFETDYNETTNN